MRSVKTLILLLPLMTGLILVQNASAETWTDATGKFSVEAKFLSVSGGNIYLETEEGKRIAVPIKRLSPESLEQAKRLYEASQSGGGATAPATASAPMPLSAGVTGESKLGANPTAKETADIMGMAVAEFDVVTIWDAFPAKHQSDIEKTVQLAANSLDAQTWNSVASLLQKASKLVSEKKDFFLNNPMIAGIAADVPEISEKWDAVAGLVDVYANSMITDQSAMKSFTMEQFIAKDVPKMRAAFQEVQRVTADLQDSPFAQMAEVPKFETVSESPTEAVFKVTQAGEEHEQKFIKVDNRWVPEEMVTGWDEGIAKAQAQLQQLATPEGQQGMAQMRMGLMMAGAPVDQLLAAKDQAEFDAVVQQLSGMVMGLMGGMGGPGGPGGPPPGFGGPPPGFGEAPPGFGEAPPGFGEAPPEIGEAPPGFDQ